MKSNFQQEKPGHRMQMETAIAWAPVLGSDIQLAACSDHGTIPDSDVLNVLSAEEQQQVRDLQDTSEKRHLAFRRCFQRLFLSAIIEWQEPLSHLPVVHKRDVPPHLKEKPSLSMSFSSSGSLFLACASFNHQVGIDVEKIRPLGNSIGLAQRFFSASEANALSHLPEDERDLAFLHYWTAKEAGLKAEGKGVDAGLHRFPIEPHFGSYRVECESENKSPTDWELVYSDFLPDHVVAIMHKRYSKP